MANDASMPDRAGPAQGRRGPVACGAAQVARTRRVVCSGSKARQAKGRAHGRGGERGSGPVRGGRQSGGRACGRGALPGSRGRLSGACGRHDDREAPLDGAARRRPAAGPHAGAARPPRHVRRVPVPAGRPPGRRGRAVHGHGRLPQHVRARRHRRGHSRAGGRDRGGARGWERGRARGPRRAYPCHGLGARRCGGVCVVRERAVVRLPGRCRGAGGRAHRAADHRLRRQLLRACGR